MIQFLDNDQKQLERAAAASRSYDLFLDNWSREAWVRIRSWAGAGTAADSTLDLRTLSRQYHTSCGDILWGQWDTASDRCSSRRRGESVAHIAKPRFGVASCIGTVVHSTKRTQDPQRKHRCRCPPLCNRLCRILGTTQRKAQRSSWSGTCLLASPTSSRPTDLRKFPSAARGETVLPVSHCSWTRGSVYRPQRICRKTNGHTNSTSRV
jgi:hypothetical protein